MITNGWKQALVLANVASIAATNPFEYLDDIGAAEGEARLNRRGEPGERVDDCEHAELAPGCKLVMDKVHRPGLIRLRGGLATRRLGTLLRNCRPISRFNPTKHADSVADMLKRSGYEVTLIKDVGNIEFKRVIRHFGEWASSAAVAVVFYAGRGIEISGASYMLFVDVRLASDRDAPGKTSHFCSGRRKAHAQDHSRCLPRQPFFFIQ